MSRNESEKFGMNRKRLVTQNLPMLRLSVAEPVEAMFVSPSFALMQKKQKIKAENPVPMGAPWSCLPHVATRHAVGMAQTAPLP
ncbi:hypothetical protein [Tenuifilum thalassicum]|uniref:Uncharacterized protein n=1 Tax=Tenuifilum thalassicum TaxID=2590900 RepID=A0A7D4BTD2_9BACT|nr:hypothetical protein [Tenuifilum thalassicum]QKG81121.1 hypothetical protein FHG85_12875 [Tenuifilum thalassicum]